MLHASSVHTQGMSQHVNLAPYLALGILFFTAACSNTLPLSYTPTMSVSQEGPPVVGKVTATDLRREADPSWYGAVRGGYGNPLKVLHSKGPVSDEVAQAFRDALRQRGLLASDQNGPYDLTVDITQFEATQMVRREANVSFKLTLINRKGEIVYTDMAQTDKLNGSLLSLDVGVFATPEDLRQVMLLAMNSTIDTLLNKPAFIAVLRSATPTS